jgi:hypothetical protein
MRVSPAELRLYLILISRITFPFTQQGQHAYVWISQLNTQPIVSPVSASTLYAAKPMNLGLSGMFFTKHRAYSCYLLPIYLDTWMSI